MPAAFTARITVEAVAHHRNGVAGAPFHVVLFRDAEGRKLAVVFGEIGHVAVLDLDLTAGGEIRFGFNSFRGDLYEPALPAAIEVFEAAQTVPPQTPGGNHVPD